MAKRSRRGLLIAVLTLFLVSLAAIAFHRPILTTAGEWLMQEDPLEKCDAALVLSGEDGDGTRTRTAVDLYKGGWVKKVILSGARASFGHYETDFSGPLALSLGVPPKDLLVIPHRGRSTFEEATQVVPELTRTGVRSFFLVTSNYHTRRAKRYFLRVVPKDMRILVHSTQSDWFHTDSWWQTREGLKFFFFEAAKTFSSVLE